MMLIMMLKTFIAFIYRRFCGFGQQDFSKFMVKSATMKAGAGGNWQRIDEKIDLNIVKQTSGLSCVSAVGEMLLKSRGIEISQHIIRDIIGEPASLESLAKALNRFDNSDLEQKWIGGFYLPNWLDVVLQKRNFGVVLQEPLTIGHAIFVEGVDKKGLVKINDLFDQTDYKMTKTEFNNFWGGGVVFYGISSIK
jgi:ABC-type bacteriocin/lantibiotic exporter with double-glycine peptidase domain